MRHVWVRISRSVAFGRTVTRMCMNESCHTYEYGSANSSHKWWDMNEWIISDIWIIFICRHDSFVRWITYEWWITYECNASHEWIMTNIWIIFICKTWFVCAMNYIWMMTDIWILFICKTWFIHSYERIHMNVTHRTNESCLTYEHRTNEACLTYE